MDNNNLVFYILREKSDDVTKDFPDFVYKLKEWFDVIQDTPSNITISGQNAYKSQIEYLSFNKPEQFSEFSFCLRLTIGVEDYVTFEKLRNILFKQHDYYRIYSEKLKCLLPKDIDLVDLEFGSVNIKTFEILKKYSLIPVYYSQRFFHYYALSSDKKVHLINPHLLEYIYDKNIPEKEFGELSYAVAPSLNLFSAMYDKDLIPVNFYEYYGKSTKIINYSGFDIENPGRKVFVKPYIFEFDDKTGSYYTYAGPKEGGSMLMMTKILKGENLDTTIKRLLKEELNNLADDYMAAMVSNKIEFDRDKEGILTPRIVVFVYVDKIKDKKWATQMSQTGWQSINGNLPKIKVREDFKEEN